MERDQNNTKNLLDYSKVLREKLVRAEVRYTHQSAEKQKKVGDCKVKNRWRERT